MRDVLKVFIECLILLVNLFAWIAIIFLVDTAFTPVSLGAKFLSFMLATLIFQIVACTGEIINWLEEEL